MFAINSNSSFDQRALSVWVSGKVREQLTLLVVVRKQFPVATQTGINHGPSSFKRYSVGRTACANAKFIEQLVEAPDTDALSVFAPTVIREIRYPTGKRVR